MSYIPYDHAILAEVKRQGKTKGFNVIGLHGPRFYILKKQNQCDIFLLSLKVVYSFMSGGYERYSQFMHILRRTRAKVFPSQKMQQFIIDKHKYMSIS